MTPGKLFWALLVMIAGFPEVEGAIRHPKVRRVPTLSNRRRMHLQNLATDPGTVEIEMGAAGSVNGVTSPFTLKFTPGAGHSFWHRTEFSLDLDAVSRLPGDLHWVTQWSDHVGVAATHLLHQGKTLSVYFAPQVAFLTRGDEGIRGGATAVVNADLGGFSVAANGTWTTATSPTESNPAGDLQIGAGLLKRIGGTKDHPRWTLFANGLQENPTSGDTTYSVFEGVSYQIRRSLAVDVSVRHLNVAGDRADHQVLGGITVNLGRPRDW